MNDIEKSLLFYMNNYHFNKSEKVYVHLELYDFKYNFYTFTIYGEEYSYKKTYSISKSKIRDKKLNQILNGKR